MNIIKYCPLVQQNFLIKPYDLSNLTRMEYWVEPIGDIESFPEGRYVHEVIEEEAKRLFEQKDMRAQRGLGMNPRMVYVINGAEYSGTFSVIYRRTAGVEYTSITNRIGVPHTESANRKLTEWFDQIREELVSPKVLKEYELDRIDAEIRSRNKAITTLTEEIRLNASYVAQLEDRKSALLHS